MASASMERETIRNTTGAIIFTAYVIAALLLTAILCRDLVNAFFLDLPKSLRNRDGLHNRIRVFACLSILSFSLLSYHMTDYLIVSYERWANERKIALPDRLYGKRGLFGPMENQRVPLLIWEWLTTSTLFQDFAQTICQSRENFWWTQQALFITMAWSVYMSVEGTWISCHPTLIL